MWATGHSAAGWAEAAELELVPAGDEAVLAGSAARPVAEVAALELDHAMTTLADQMMVMPVTAEAIAALLGVVRERIDHPPVAQEVEGAVDGRETDRPVALVAQPLPESLRGRVVRLVGKLGQDGEPLLRRADVLRAQKPFELRG